LDNQQKPEQPSQGQSQTPASPQAAQLQGVQQTNQKKPYRRYYGNRKRFKPQGEQSHSPSAIQKLSFKKISIVVPLLNEDESLRPLYNEIKKVVKGISSDYELLFIDDGSTRQVIKRNKRPRAFGQ